MDAGADVGRSEVAARIHVGIGGHHGPADHRPVTCLTIFLSVFGNMSIREH